MEEDAMKGDDGEVDACTCPDRAGEPMAPRDGDGAAILVVGEIAGEEVIEVARPEEAIADQETFTEAAELLDWLDA